jgi:hypothetical protein
MSGVGATDGEALGAALLHATAMAATATSTVTVRTARRRECAMAA